jgi:hypothetical protein
MSLADFGGSPSSDNGAGGNSGSTTTTGTIPPENNGTGCKDDSDCNTEGGFNPGLCCYASEYQGYSCAGRCTYYTNIGRDACKHPAACGIDTNKISDLNVCTNKKIGNNLAPDLYCKKAFASGIVYQSDSKCCAGLTPCAGYCLTGGSYDCNDITACQEENQIMVSTPTGVEQ